MTLKYFVCKQILLQNAKFMSTISKYFFICYNIRDHLIFVLEKNMSHYLVYQVAINRSTYKPSWWKGLQQWPWHLAQEMIPTTVSIDYDENWYFYYTW